MLAENRRRRLVELIAHRGFATLDELVRTLGVSESTVRRDLEALDAAGSVKRTHGGAVYSGEVRAMPALDEREASQAIEKRAIGNAAAALVEDEDTVLLDGGTTTLEVARALAGRPLQVVTNSLPIAQLLTASKDTDLILIGGYVYPRTGEAMGPLTVAALESIRVGKVILGVGRDHGRRGLQLEFAARRNRAADDALRSTGDRGRRQHEVRSALPLPPLRARGGQRDGGRPGPEGRSPRDAGGAWGRRFTWRRCPMSVGPQREPERSIARRYDEDGGLR